VSFTPRLYPDIVRDLLTVLTGGTVAESFTIPDNFDGTYRLLQAPVQRVSHLEGQVQLDESHPPIAYQFTERDFELVGTDDRPKELSTIRFRPQARRPVAGSQLTVNYYPSRTKPTPLNDVNVGSVTRTLLETVAWELAGQYQQLDRVYKSAFVDTAEGASLERVVALVDVQRLAQGHPVGKVRFFRPPGSAEDVFIPINTVISDGKGARYLTSQDGQMSPSQTALEVWVHGEALRTRVVKAGELTVLERAIAGVHSVVNDEAMFNATDAERDDQLAARARRAIHGTGRGTLDAIQFAVQNLPFVSSVKLVERPDGVPGTLRVDVALTEDSAYKQSLVEQAVRDYRPAGIQVTVAYAGRVKLAFHVSLVLKGATAPTSVVTEITDGVASRLDALVKGLSPGGVIRRARLTATLLDDPRIVDATLSYTAGGSAVTADNFTLPDGQAARLDREDVVFDRVRFDEQSSQPGPRVVQLDADLTVHLIKDGADESAAEATARDKLSRLVAGLHPGSGLGFDDALTALRDNDVFVVTPDKSTLELVEDSGAFVELRDADPAYLIAADTTVAVRNVKVTQDTD
jgi:uncharacterized phage protein gp47/JayE